MAGARFRILVAVACVLTVSVTRSGWADDDPAPEPSRSKVYSLAHLGDPELGQWIASTIPQVIQPETWGPSARNVVGLDNAPPLYRTLSYYGPARILVVYHTAKVHEEVAAFLKSVEKALPRRAAGTETTGRLPPFGGYPGTLGAGRGAPAEPVMPARYASPQPIAESVRAPSAEAPKTQPKHLFHIILDGMEFKSGDQESKLKNFTLRYEGEGIIDSNVASLLKSLYKAGAVSQRWDLAAGTPPNVPGTSATSGPVYLAPAQMPYSPDSPPATPPGTPVTPTYGPATAPAPPPAAAPRY